MEVLVGITGGIAAYKTATLVSRLVQSGYGVSVLMTQSATQLISPKTFESLTNRPVMTGLFDAHSHAHIELGRKAHLLCVAPATANFLAKTANGIADDLLSTVYLAFEGPVLLAPAMNSVMWSQPAVQRNVRRLQEDGVLMIGPESGRLSCGETGTGRMSEPDQIVAEIQRIFSNLPELSRSSDKL